MDFLREINQTVRYTAPFAGMRIALHLNPAERSTAPGRLEKIKVVPNPYIASSIFDSGPNKRSIMFTNLPQFCTIKIITVSGVLVRELHAPEDCLTTFSGMGQSNNGVLHWDMLTEEGLEIAAGMYIYHVKDDDSGEEKLGKFGVIK